LGVLLKHAESSHPDFLVLPLFSLVPFTQIPEILCI